MSAVPRLQAYVWWCQDEVCDCNQPVVELVQRHPTLGGTACKTTRLWEGKYISEPDADEWLEQRAELTFAASRFHIKLDPETWSGERGPIPTATAIHYLEQAGKL